MIGVIARGAKFLLVSASTEEDLQRWKKETGGGRLVALAKDERQARRIAAAQVQGRAAAGIKAEVEETILSV